MNKQNTYNYLKDAGLLYGNVHNPNGGGGLYPEPGNRYFVDSTATAAADTNDGASWDSPLATLDGAINKCTANNGDIIVLAPGHTEDVASAGAITCDVAGVTIISAGQGSDRATFTFITLTTASIVITADSVTIVNCDFVGAIDSLATMIALDAAGTSFIGCAFSDGGSANCLKYIDAATGSSELSILGCSCAGSSKPGSASFLEIIGSSNLRIEDCYISGDFSVANIVFITTSSVDLRILNNTLINHNGVDINIEGNSLANSGVIAKNNLWIPTDGEVTWITDMVSGVTNELLLAENYGANQGGETGKLVGTASV